ncbi:retroviral aspartyl protease, partial [Opisthorchis viverrini]
RPSNRTQFKFHGCGGRHNNPKDCRHTQAVCNRCKKRGHLGNVCRSAPAFETNAAVTNQVTRSEIPEYVVHAAAATKRVQLPYQVELQVNNASVVFELDTGSAVTICSEKSWQDNLEATVKGKLQQAPVRLRTYTGEEVKLLGKKNVNVSYKGVTVNETIYIAEGSGRNLLGRDWLHQLPILMLIQVSTLLEVQYLIRNYEEVFSEPKTGKFSGG